MLLPFSIWTKRILQEMQRRLPLGSLVTGADRGVAGNEIQLHRGTAEGIEKL